MPQLAAWAVAAVVSVTSAVVAAGPIAVAAFNAVNVAAVAAGASAAMKVLQPRVPQSGAEINLTADPDAPMHFAAGRIGTGGQAVHTAVYGPDNMYVSFVAVLSAAGPINSYVNFKANDLAVTFDGSGLANTSDYANEMWLAKQLGAQPTTTALASPSGLRGSASLPNWGSSYKLNGKAAVLWTLAENSKYSAYKGRVPAGVHTIEGLKGWDPRLDSTYPGGSGSCRLDTPSTWVYLTNPNLWALKWALGLWEGPTGKGAPGVDYQVGGIGAKIEGIDVAAFVEAANVADANGWTVAAWPSAEDDKAQVLDSFLQAGGAIYAEKAGKISCVHRAAERSSVATITGRDTAGPIRYTTTLPLKSRINTIRPRFWDEANGWQMTATDEVTSTDWQEEDGQGVARKRSRGVDYNYVPASLQARELAALQIAHTREGITGTIPLRPYMGGVEVGDCITLTEPDFVLDGLKCLVLKVDDQTEADVINIEFVSETDGKYAFAFGQSASPPPAPTLSPPSLFEVTPPQPAEWTLVAGVITGDDGAEVPALVVTGTVENARATGVIFEYRRDGATDWIPAGTDGPDVVRKQILGLAPGDWEVAVSYRVGPNVSSREILGPETLGSIVVPLTPTVMDDAGVIRVPGGYSGGGFEVTTDTADRLDAGLGLLSGKDTTATADIDLNAATKPARYDSASETDWVVAGIATGPITTRATVFSTSIIATGAEIIVNGSFFLRLQHSQDDVVLYVVVERLSTGGGGTVDVFEAGTQSLAISGDGFISGWQVISFTDTPPAGTVDYYVRVYHTYSIGSPGGFVTWKHRNRTMSFLETKR